MADTGLRSLFTPDRVAVVGATERPGSVGGALMANLATFEGEVVPVNPNRDSVRGRRCYPDLASVPGSVDLVVVAVPPEPAVEAVRTAAREGVRNVVVVTAGFGESGSEGAARERELRSVAREHDLNLVGPNCLGVMSTPPKLNASFGPDAPLPGSISFLSQSGAFVTSVVDWAADAGIGFRDIVSLGNKAVLDETDFVRAWGEDPGTSVVTGYLESIVDGREFIDAAREVTAETPVVLVKSGRTEAGARAASSHTGAIAGSERAYRAGLDQAGVIRAENAGELFDAARALDGLPLPAGDGVAVVTNAGGPGVMTTDAIGDAGLSLASFGAETVDALEADLPDGANLYNPVDVIGDADAERFRGALETVVADPDVAMVVVVASPTAVLEFDRLAEVVVEVQADRETPVVTSLMGGERAEAPGDRLAEAGIPNYFDPARAVRSLEALVEYRRVRAREYEAPRAFDVDRNRARKVLRSVEDRATNRLGVEAMGLLEAYGIPTPAAEIVESPADAERAARDLPTDAVMKIVSPDIIHKSDIGGVEVGVPASEAAEVYEELVTRARNYQPDAQVLGVQVQELVDVEGGTETIVGMNRDPQFGPLLLFGLGGVFVEVLEDTAVRVAPVSEREARNMTEEIRSAPLLRGARGRDPADVDAVVETIQRLSQLVDDFPAILELDVNPLVATADGVRAVDVRLTVEGEKL